MRIGLISDTHGLLRPQALAALQGSDHIVHAGDIGQPATLDALARLAPLTCVRGNNDVGLDWAAALPDTARLTLGGVRLLVLHDLATLTTDVAADGIAVVVSGHSHRPAIERRGGVLFVNPGSAGPRRFKLPVSIGEVRVDEGKAEARWIALDLGVSGSPTQRC